MSSLISHRMNESGQRGAALILEIIIYLVIVSLIAVAVTSGVKSIRDLTFGMHAKADVMNLRDWMESKYAQDGKYPGVPEGGPLYDSSAPLRTNVGGSGNHAYISSVNGASSGYCVLIYSTTISDQSKIRFWLSSSNPSKIYQGGTASNGFSTSAPPSGVDGVTCQL